MTVQRILILLLSILILTGCAQDNQPGQHQLTWWGWLLIVTGLMLFAWLIYLLTRDKTPRPSVPHRMAEPVKDSAFETIKENSILKTISTIEEIKPATHVPHLHDDFTIIEGIGPKINTVLQGAGISTFSDLAELDSEKIKSIISHAGIKLPITSSWIEQAKLAADNKMEELKALQATLRNK